MNIDFERDNYKFNARVSAIILNKEKNKKKGFHWAEIFGIIHHR